MGEERLIREKLAALSAEERFRAHINAIASRIDRWFNIAKRGNDRSIGFALFVYPFGTADGSGAMYITNGATDEHINAMFKAFIVRREGVSTIQPDSPNDV